MNKYKIYGQVFQAQSPQEAWQQYAAQNSPGLLGGLAQQFNQGVTLGGADELQAGVEKIAGRDYSTSLERQRREREAFQSKYPWLSAGATAAGAIAPVAMATVGGSIGGPAGVVGAGTTAGGRALQLTLNALYGGGNAIRNVNTVKDAVREGTRYGFTPGAVTGALSAEPENRTQGAVFGAATGTGVGGTFGGGSQALVSGGARLAPYAQKVVQFLGLADTAPVSRMAATTGVMPTAPLSSAELKILQSLEASGVTPEVAAMQLARARETGVPLGLVDVGGQGVQRLARGVRAVGGEGANVIDTALTSRATQQPDRVINFLEKALGQRSSVNTGAVSDSLLMRARGSSSPFYKQLEDLPPVNSQEALKIFDLPFVKDIMQRAQRTADSMAPGSMAPLYNNDGLLMRAPTFRDVDFVKQQIDEILAPVYQQGPRPADAVDIGTRQARDLAKAVRDRLVSAADAAPGGDIYAQARANYAGPAQARDMYQQGLDFPRKDTMLQDVRATIADNTPASNDWYRRGVVDSLRGRIMGMDDITSRPNVLRSFYGNPAAREKLDAAVPTQNRDMLNEQLAQENQAAQTSNFVRGGSPTVDKTADAAEALDVAADMAGATTQGAKATAVAAISKVYNALRSSVNEKTRAEIANQLTNFDNPEAQQAFLQRLIEQRRVGELTAQDVAATARTMSVQQELE